MVLENFALEKFVVRENVLEKVSYNHFEYMHSRRLAASAWSAKGMPQRLV